MNARLEVSEQELDLLITHLARHIDALDHDLVRTDKADLQHALAREVETLQSLLERLKKNLH
jgi:hypothetical protein